MKMSNCLQLHVLKRLVFSFARGQDNLPNNFGKCSLGCPSVLEDDLALLSYMEAFSCLLLRGHPAYFG